MAKAAKRERRKPTYARMKGEIRAAEKQATHGGTGATILKMARSPVARLVESGKIGPAELQAATEIELAFVALSGGLLLKPLMLERVDKSRKTEWSSRTADAVERYRAWADYWSVMAKRGAPALAITIALVIDQWAFSAVEDDRGLRHGKASKVLAAMLRDYAARAGWCDGRLMQRWKDEAAGLFRAVHPDYRMAQIAAEVV